MDMPGRVCVRAAALRAHFVCVCVRVHVENKKKKKKRRTHTNGDETDTFPDGSANITLPDVAHVRARTHAQQMHYVTDEGEEELGL